MPLDWSALAPGPMGTAMLGESGIEGAARRGRERIQREQEEQRALGNQQYPDPEMIHTQSNKPKSETPRDDIIPSVTSNQNILADQGIVDSRKQSGGIKGKLSRFKKHLTG